MKVTIKNFQSIEHCEIEIPEKAFTCIVGPSNIGKSAIRRALECIFYNKSDGSYVRNGTDSCEVNVCLADGTDIKWTRTKKGEAKYIINGDLFENISKTVPQILIDKGFSELKTSKEKFSVQIAPQFDNIFLLNQIGSKVTEVFSNLGNLNKIINSNKLCSADLRNNKIKLGIRREDLSVLKEKLKKYSRLDEQSNLFDKIKEDFFNIKNKKEKLSQIINLNDLFIHSNTKLKTLIPLKTLSIPIIDIDLNTFLLAKNFCQQYTKIEYRLDLFGKIPQKEIKFDLDEQYKKYIEIVNITNLFEKSKNLVILYKKLPKEIPLIEDIDLVKIKNIKELYQQFLKSKENLLRVRKKIEETDNKLNELIKEKNQIKVCPLCDRPF